MNENIHSNVFSIIYSFIPLYLLTHIKDFYCTHKFIISNIFCLCQKLSWFGRKSTELSGAGVIKAISQIIKELIVKYERISKILKPNHLGLFYPFTPSTPEELTDLGSGGSVQMWGLHLTVERTKQEVLATLWTKVEWGLQGKSVSHSVMSKSCCPMDCSQPGSSVHRILQARILEWGAIPLSRGSSRPKDWIRVSWIAGRLFTIWATREALEYAGPLLIL